jgi:hypothetical protein
MNQQTGREPVRVDRPGTQHASTRVRGSTARSRGSAARATSSRATECVLVVLIILLRGEFFSTSDLGNRSKNLAEGTKPPSNFGERSTKWFEGPANSPGKPGSEFVLDIRDHSMDSFCTRAGPGRSSITRIPPSETARGVGLPEPACIGGEAEPPVPSGPLLDRDDRSRACHGDPRPPA